VIKTSVILAAGRGVRMGPSGREIPKGFITIDGETLIRRSLAHLFRHGIGRVVIVTGHLDESYRQLAAEDPQRIACVHNANYAALGSLESLRVGLAAVDEAVLVLESDLIYEGRMIDAMLRRRARGTVLVTDPTDSGDEVHVWSRPVPGGGHAFEAAHKDLALIGRPPLGEYPGVFAIGGEARRGVLDCAPGLLAASPMADYESALMAVATDMPIECLRMPDLVWAEIDDPRMLRRVEDVVYPRLAALEATRPQRSL
jgi:2-aminoethylphosphonate-pyruvate transaminase